MTSSPPDVALGETIAALWVADGIAGVTHRRVAEAAGVSKGKLQHAYPTVADLVAAGVAALIPPPGPGLLWGQLEFSVHALLGYTPSGSEITPDVPSARDLAAVEAYVWVARHAAR